MRTLILLCGLFFLPIFFYGQNFDARYFIYFAGNDINNPQQVYIPEYAISDGAVSTNKEGDRYRINLNKGYKYKLIHNGRSLGELDFYDYSGTLSANPFRTKYTLSENNVVSSYKDIDSYRMPRMDEYGQVLLFQKYNRDVGVLCFLKNPLTARQFDFVNPANSQIQANAWGEIEKISERDADIRLRGERIECVYVKNRRLYYTPNAGDPSASHVPLTTIAADYISPLRSASGNQLRYAVKNELFEATLNPAGSLSGVRSLRKFKVDAIYKLIPNPQYANLILLRFMKNDQVGVAIFDLNQNEGLHEITRRRGEDDINPAWSPDGKRIAFVRRISQGDGFQFQLYQHNFSTNQSTRLTDEKLVVDNSVYPVWTPDGKGIFIIASSPANLREKSLYLCPANSRSRPFKVDLEIKGRSFNTLSDLEIFPKNLAAFSGEQSPVYLFITAARSTKNEIYRLALGNLNYSFSGGNAHNTVLSILARGVSKDIFNPWLNSTDEVSRVEALRSQYAGILDNYGQRIAELERGSQNMPELTTLTSGQVSLKYAYYQKKYDETKAGFGPRQHALLDRLKNTRQANLQNIRKVFSEEDNRTRYEQIRRKQFSRGVEDIFSDVDRLIKKYQKDDDGIIADIRSLKGKMEGELQQIVTADKNYDSWVSRVKDSFEFAEKSYRNTLQNMKDYASKTISQPDIVKQAGAELNRRKPQSLPDSFTPDRYSERDLTKLRKNYESLPYTYREIYQDFVEDMRRAEQKMARKASGDRQPAHFELGLMGGAGLGENSGHFLAPAIKWNFAGNFTFNADINFLNQFMEKSIYSKADSLDFTSDSVAVSDYDFSEKLKYFEFSLGLEYRFDVTEYVEMFAGAGANFKRNKLTLNDKGEDKFYSYYQIGDTTKTTVTEFADFAFYPYLSTGLNYTVNSSLKMGLNIRYIIPFGLGLGGDKFGDFVHKNHYPGKVKKGLVRPDGKFIESSKLNSLYINLSLMILL